MLKAWVPASLKIGSTLDPVIAFISGQMAHRLVILLGGGTKKRQQRDINRAIAMWQEYKRRKQGDQ